MSAPQFSGVIALLPGGRPGFHRSTLLSSEGEAAPAMLTDGVCFSSCLDVVSNWRDLGAIQLGETSDTHYTEVRDDPMPSGLSTFSTMMGIDMDSPARQGPFVPSELYEGDIRDTPALEAWVLRIAAKRTANP